MPSRVPSSLAIATHRSTSPARGFGCVSLFQNNDRRRDLISVNTRLGPRILQAHEGAQDTPSARRLANRPEIRHPCATVLKLWEIIWHLVPNSVKEFPIPRGTLARISVVQTHRAGFLGRLLFHDERAASRVQLVAYLGHGLPEDMSPEESRNPRNARHCDAIVGGVDKKDIRRAGELMERRSNIAKIVGEPFVVGGMNIKDRRLHLVHPLSNINDLHEPLSPDGMKQHRSHEPIIWTLAHEARIDRGCICAK
mmetsp:Transcript_61862/g.133015  ORF Transcript_61862/g.133015 Transcript_61862/m.133015 type:complete len:253 (+) Transcript_61862:128-886(+)